MKYSIKDIVKNRDATFVYYRQHHLYYKVTIIEDDISYIFPIPVADLMEASVNVVERAITLMRYIRKAIDDGTFVRYY